MIRALPAGRSAAEISLGLLGALFLSLGLTGCPGTLDPAVAAAAANGGGGSSGGTPCDLAAVTTVIGKYGCTTAGSCHGGATPISGFDMSMTGWEMNLVGKTPSATTMSMACATNGVPYLKPGVQPADGLFLQKIKGTQGCGTAMPYPGVTPVAQADVACFQSFANGLVAAAGGGGNSDAGGGQ